MDNSPAWDEALSRVEGVALPAGRRDTQHVGANQRSSTAEYERYLGLVSFP